MVHLKQWCLSLLYRVITLSTMVLHHVMALLFTCPCWNSLHSEYGTFEIVVPLGLLYRVITLSTMVLHHVMALFVHLSLLEQLTFRIWSIQNSGASWSTTYRVITLSTMVLHHVMTLFVHLSLLEQLTFRIRYI